MGTKANPGPNDCYAAAADDEPIFTLRASDVHAAQLVRDWASRRLQRLRHQIKAGGITVDDIKRVEAKVDEAWECAKTMTRYHIALQRSRRFGTSIHQPEGAPKARPAQDAADLMGYLRGYNNPIRWDQSVVDYPFGYMPSLCSGKPHEWAFTIHQVNVGMYVVHATYIMTGLKYVVCNGLEHNAQPKMHFTRSDAMQTIKALHEGAASYETSFGNVRFRGKSVPSDPHTIPATKTEAPQCSSPSASMARGTSVKKVRRKASSSVKSKKTRTSRRASTGRSKSSTR